MVLVVATLLVYAQVCAFDFVLWDDPINLIENPYVQRFTAQNMTALWTQSYASLYMPLTYSVWSVVAAWSRGLSGSSTAMPPAVFHSLNLLTYLATVLAVWRLAVGVLERTNGDGVLADRSSRAWAAAAGALLFALHPLHVEPVAWATGFKDLLGGGLAIVALWQYVCSIPTGHDADRDRRSSRRHFAAATIAFALALLAKQTTVVVPAMAAILHLWLAPRAWKSGVARLIAWLVMAALWAWVTARLHPVPPGLLVPPWWQRLLVAADALGFYLIKLTFPVRLATDYGRRPEWVLARSFPWIALLGVLIAAASLWRMRAKRPWAISTFALVVMALVPVLGLVPFEFQLYSTVADRYAYLALLGPALAAAWLIARTPTAAVARGVVAGACVLALISGWQAHYWRNTETLFAHELDIRPQSVAASSTLGLLRARQGRLDDAIALYQSALASSPQNFQVHNNLGDALRRQGNAPAAIEHFRRALALHPAFTLAHNNLGATLTGMGRVDEGIAELNAALIEDPAYADAHYNLASALARAGRAAEARGQYELALRFRPAYPEAHHNLGVILAAGGSLPEAMAHQRAAIALRPDYTSAHYNLALVLLSTGRSTEGRLELEQVLRLDPGHAGARQLLSAINRQ